MGSAHKDVDELSASLDARGMAKKDQEQTMVEQDPELQELQTAATNGVNIRSKFGQRFSRQMSNLDGYKELKTHREKAEFRRRWASAEFQKVKEEKYFKSEHNKIDTNLGTYLPVSMIVDAEGGQNNADARVAGAKYISKCIMMGGKWCMYNGMTERMEYLHIRKQCIEQFHRSWGLFTSFERSGEVDHQQKTHCLDA